MLGVFIHTSSCGGASSQASPLHLDAKRQGQPHTSARCVGRAGLTPLPPRGGRPEPGWSPVCRFAFPAAAPPPARASPRRVPAESPRNCQGKRRRPVRAPCELQRGPSGLPRDPVSNGSGPSSDPAPGLGPENSSPPLGPRGKRVPGIPSANLGP